MSSIRIESVGEPFDRHDVAEEAMSVISTASAMGLLEGLQLRKLDRPSFRQVVDRLAEAGIGREVSPMLAASAGPEVPGTSLKGVLRRLATALEESPVPAKEWPALESVLETDRLAALVGISPTSLRRYRVGARATPDLVAARLHLLATVIGDLAGAYNDVGVRRWFERRRAALDGRTPAELLTGEWDPDDPGPQKVRRLARSLTATAAT